MAHVLKLIAIKLNTSKNSYYYFLWLEEELILFSVFLLQ